jgi:hypothetical protein|tara:strand:+ start:547 stop:681 length:135 start_codon:yes stop_codon:yes gene_type:complete
MSKTSAKGRYNQLMSWLKGYKSSPVSNFKKQQRNRNTNQRRSAR